MTDTVQLSEHPKADEVYMIAGWRQWADAGSLSSGLPQYLIQQMKARKIGTIRPDGFYLFQIPGTHDLVRPVIKFNQGYPESLQTQTNELFYAGDERRGMVLFLGDEPHLDVEHNSRLALLRETGIPYDSIEEMVKLADLCRISDIKGLRVRLLFDTGFDTIEKIATQDPEEMRDQIIKINQGENITARHPTLTETKFWVEQAKKLPKLVEY